jgi:hypothetical protein
MNTLSRHGRHWLKTSCLKIQSTPFIFSQMRRSSFMDDRGKTSSNEPLFGRRVSPLSSRHHRLSQSHFTFRDSTSKKLPFQLRCTIRLPNEDNNSFNDKEFKKSGLPVLVIMFGLNFGTSSAFHSLLTNWLVL